MKSEDVLKKIILLFTNYLEELSHESRNDFIHGEMTAYVECLELLADWHDAAKLGLTYDIAKKYNI